MVNKYFIHYTGLIWILGIAVLYLSGCSKKENISLQSYYSYDHAMPLKDSVQLVIDTTDYSMSYITFRSVHERRVTGLLSVPKNSSAPHPVIILMHGLGDEKTVDYIEVGHEYLLNAGYAVLRLDIEMHGDRKGDEYEFGFTDGYPYWTRNIISQTAFDLQRSVDFLEKRPEIDSERIGYFGISLGGMIGTVFCGLDERVKVPVIVIAGGGFHFMFGKKALSDETADFLSIIDPINFVENIYPRPLLMINAENDEVIPPMSSKLLFQKAKEPKKIIWYPEKHRTISPEKVYSDGINWYNEYL